MKATRTFRPKFAVMILAACAACSSANQDANTETSEAEPQSQPEVPSFDAQYEEMVAVMGLGPDEASRLKAAFDARGQKLTDWLNGPEGQALFEEQAALEEAVEERDVQGVRAITRKATTERAKFQAVIDSTEADIRAVLTQDQLITWDGHRIAEQMLDVLSDVPLTEEQIYTIREWAPGYLDLAMRDGESNPMAAAYVALEKELDARVITPNQRQAFENAKKNNPMRTLVF